MVITQNIDGLEVAAGVPREKVFNCHGTWATQRCIVCKEPFPDERMKEAVLQGTVPRCLVSGCGGIVKPDIVMFGEPLPAGFKTKAEEKVVEADLVFVMGTSLKVHPFARLPSMVPEGVPRLLINRERVGDLGTRNGDDLCLLGDCDGEVRRLADVLGWREELEVLWEEAQKKCAGEEGEEGEDYGVQLDKAIDRLVGLMDESLNISKGHKSMLEKHLSEKMTRLPKSVDGDE